MSTSWSNPPGDPVEDVIRAFRELKAKPKPRTAYVRDVAPLLDHVETRGYEASDPIARLSGIPIRTDADVEPGWLELREWNGDIVARVRLA